MSLNETKSPAALFVDFDGTIVNDDTAQLALDRFGEPGWARIDEALERGEISFEDSLRQEFATLNAPPKTIIDEVSRLISFRPNFDRLIDYCRSTLLPITVVSGGLDFCIQHLLNRGDWLRFVKICAPVSHFTGSGYTLTFPEATRYGSTSFKDGLVRYEKARGSRVFFVGNGYGDLSAAKEATFVFAIRGSKLAHLCREQEVKHMAVDDFQEVIDHLQLHL